MKLALKRYEMETSINFNEYEKTACVYTCKKSLMKKLDKYCEDYPDKYKLIAQDENSKTYEMKKTLISFRKPRKKKILSEEEKRKFRKRITKNSNLNKTFPYNYKEIVS